MISKAVEIMNKELREMRENFIKRNNIHCINCQRFIKNKCTSKVYCIVRDPAFFCAYIEKPDLCKVEPVNLYSDLTDDEVEQLNLEMECTNPND